MLLLWWSPNEWFECQSIWFSWFDQKFWPTKSVFLYICVCVWYRVVLFLSLSVVCVCVCTPFILRMNYVHLTMRNFFFFFLNEIICFSCLLIIIFNGWNQCLLPVMTLKTHTHIHTDTIASYTYIMTINPLFQGWTHTHTQTYIDYEHINHHDHDHYKWNEIQAIQLSIKYITILRQEKKCEISI